MVDRIGEQNVLGMMDESPNKAKKVKKYNYNNLPSLLYIKIIQ